MIHINIRPAPSTFNANVYSPGQQWLSKNSHPPKPLPAYWRRALPDLRRAYKGICSYFCCFVYPTTGAGSADHFVPKSKAASVAYDWSNYRFACSRMNSRQSDASDVLDPFTLTDGLFAIYFPTLRVRPAKGLSKTVLKQVRSTIKRLKLNSRECIEERKVSWENYRHHGLQARRLIELAPFIAMEAARQGLLIVNPGDASITVADVRTWLDS